MTRNTVPADFEPLSAVVLSAARLGIVFPQIFVDVISELIDLLPVVVLVRDEHQREELLTHLVDAGLPGRLVYFVHSPASLMWVRDYGPQFVRRSDGSFAMLDADYFRTELPEEDRTPQALGNLLRLPVAHVPLTVEGGNILSNGQGICLTTHTFLERNAQRGLSNNDLGRTFKQHYGFEYVVALEPLRLEVTGHVDMFATFLSPDTVLVGQYDPRIDPVNADVLDRNANLLAGLNFPCGRLNVLRIPMPRNRGDMWRSYTNVLFVNGRLLVPTYRDSDPDLEHHAHEVYRRLLPDWDLRPIDGEGLIKASGVLRCLSCPVPRSDHFTSLFADDVSQPAPRAGAAALGV